MIRRIFAILLVALTFAAAPAEAQKKPFQIFIVQWRGDTEIDRGLKDYLARAGVAAEYTVRNAAQNHEKLKEIVKEIKAKKPDLIYAFATEGALGVVGPYDAPDPQNYVTDIPVVFAAVGDPEAAKIAEKLPLAKRPITGVIHLAPVDVQFEALRQFTTIKRLGVMYNKAETYGRAAVATLQELAKKSGVELIIESPVGEDGKPSKDLIRPALERIAAQKPDFLYLPSTSFFIPLAQPLTEEALSLGLPIFSANEPMIRRGKAVVGLVASFYEVGQFAGLKVEQILVQKKPANQVPIETLSRFSMVINMEVSRQLKVYPPLTMLRYAQVIDGQQQ